MVQSVEKLIKTTITSTMSDVMTRIKTLELKVAKTQLPVYCNKTRLCKLLGLNRRTIDILLANDVLKENVHFRVLAPGTHPVFYIEAILKELMPRACDAHFNAWQEEQNLSDVQI